MTFTAQEACEYINKFFPISYNMTRYYLRNGSIKGTYKGTMWYVEKKEVDRFIRNRMAR